MAEALVSGTLKKIAIVAAKNAQEQFKLVTGVENEIIEVKRSLRSIRAVLKDAEEKQMEEGALSHSIKDWLGKLKAASFEMENVLDQWNTELLKLKIPYPQYISYLEKVCGSFISYLLSWSRRFFINKDIGTKIRKINQALRVINREKDDYHFYRTNTKKFRRQESTSFFNSSVLHGRDEEKEYIMSKLLPKASDREVSSDIQIIFIVGAGGIGKTSLARMIFNDVSEPDDFDKKIWVCVSNVLDPMKMAKEIFENFDKSRTSNHSSLQIILEDISDIIKYRKIFFVLDDVWADQDSAWNGLLGALKSCMAGSRILVTTRKETVTTTMTEMGSSHTYCLQLLSDELCWSIVKDLAFKGRVKSECKKFEVVGRKLVSKCKGLPLAAKTLGSLLRKKKSVEEWQNILDSRLWELRVKEDIFNPLFLSYYDLPPEVRPCLLYCAIFPKDYAIVRSRLILYWMAQGYLNGDGMKRLTGEECFKHLVDCSFFQDFERDDDGRIYKCKMHDMIHEFVQFLTENEVEAIECNSRDGLLLQEAHHLRVTIEQENQFAMFMNEVKNSRSLVTVVAPGMQPSVSGKTLQSLFNRVESLRLLEFSLHRYDTVAVDQVPKEIGQLIYLRYLGLSYSSKLENLPEVVCELYNLRVLAIKGCESLKQLPHGMWKLVNLTDLYTEGCDSLKYYPKGIRSLRLLRVLDRVIARIDGCGGAKEFSIGDMENLDSLCTLAKLELVGNKIDSKEANKAKARLHREGLLHHLTIILESKLDKAEVIRALDLDNARFQFWFKSIEQKKFRPSSSRRKGNVKAGIIKQLGF